VVVTVVHIRVVRVLVAHRFVAMPMGMGLGHRLVMRMLVVFVMDMSMLVIGRLMPVLMLVAFGKV
jgi:hypothetical protein